MTILLIMYKVVPQLGNKFHVYYMTILLIMYKVVPQLGT